jgi:hypothetical protein
MVVADVLAVVFSLLAVFLAVPSFLLLTRALAPRIEAQSSKRFRLTPIRTVVIGVVLSVMLLAPGIGLLQVPFGPIRVLGVWWIAATMATSLAGLGGLAAHIGASLPGPNDEIRPWWPTLKGAIVLELACMIPVLGWFALFPLLLCAGTGAAVLAVVKPLRDPPVGAAQVTELRAHA